jgi:hypothetical protein
MSISRGSQVRRHWIPLTLSATVHLLLVAAALGLSHRTAERDSAERAQDPADQARRVEMIYVPPPEAPPRVVAPNRPLPPPPVKRRTEPEPEANAPPEAIRSKGTESDNLNPPAGEQVASAPAPKPPAPVEEATATLESEARRIFGRPRTATPPGAGPQAARPMEAYAAEHPERCMARPAAPSDSGGAAQYGMVIGRIFRQDNGRPLAGAHLQMLGAPYVAFTDGNGEYRFRFDLALVDNCRTQYVRVTARGYESRLLVLVVGSNTRSEDVRLRRH